jgi:hypothetical protein
MLPLSLGHDVLGITLTDSNGAVVADGARKLHPTRGVAHVL